MFRGMACFVISGQASKPEQHLDIEVCGSGLVMLLSVKMIVLMVALCRDYKAKSSTNLA